MTPRLVLVPLAVTLLAACAPTIKVATPDPVKIDVHMRVDVYSKEDPKKTETSRTVQMDAAEKRRNRMTEIQTLKDNLLIGENREGFIEVRKLPDDAKWAERTKQVVAEENEDRKTLYAATATKQNKPVDVVQREAAESWRERAFPKEWIQLPDGNWTQTLDPAKNLPK